MTSAQEASSRGTRFRRWVCRMAGGALFLLGFVLLAVYLPLLVLVLAGALQPGLAAGPVETAPPLSMMIGAIAVGGLLCAAGLALRIGPGGSADLARFRRKPH